MPARARILIVEDEKNAREGMKWSLDPKLHEVAAVASGEEAMAWLGDHEADLVLTDLKMPGMSGVELLERVKAADPSVEVIVITAHGDVENAVDAMRKGAFHYLTKPVRLDELRLQVERAIQRRGLARENEELKKAVEERYGFAGIVGRSAAMEEVFRVVRQVAPSRVSVLVQGESGTGKELIARAIHHNSPRAKGPFVAVNCGALAAGLLESELFGHEKGAFTHAIQTRAGRFEKADGGTIFLDEIGETTPDFQVRLLRVLQERAFERVGGSETIKVDARVVAATNRDLEKMVAEGRFREDLYYRLNVVTIRLPPLRERRDDIPLLVAAFLREFGEQNGRPDVRVSPKAMALLREFDWPGNVRQLRNVIEGLVVMGGGKEIQPRALPESIRGATGGGRMSVPVGATLAEIEREAIRATLALEGGNRTATAKRLGIGRKTLYRKLEEYGLEPPGSTPGPPEGAP